MLTVAFPKDFVEAKIEVPTLALVAPDLHPETQSLVLIGTNTLDELYEQYLNSETSQHRSSLYGYRVILKTLDLRAQTEQRGQGRSCEAAQ